APRAYDIDWPTRTESSSVSVTLATADGTKQRIEKTGPWSLFHMVETSRLVSRGAADRFEFTIGQPDGPRITYELRASSVSNPFSLTVLRAF
ncbi:type VI secretion IcmF C-terminal domain-containing protein, partial [Enterococcus faecium]